MIDRSQNSMGREAGQLMLPLMKRFQTSETAWKCEIPVALIYITSFHIVVKTELDQPSPLKGFKC